MLKSAHRDRRADCVAVGVLVLLHAVWASLLLVRPDRFCFSDCVIEMLPRLLAVARSLQSGALPFWDVSTFTGAKPFWMSTGGIYYPLLYPLYLLTDTQDLRQASLLLQVLPYVLHVLWASLGGYFFARRVIDLNARGSLVLGLFFGFSPAMLTLYFINQVLGYSYLPWITLAAVRVLDTGSTRTWAAGALLVGAMCFATNPDMVNRTLVLVGVQAFAYWLASRRRTAWSGRAFARLLALLPMVLLGVGTYSFGFVGVFTGISMALKSLSLSCEQVAAFTDYSSVHPTALLTVLYPGLFVSMWELANVGAGALLLSAVSFAFATSRSPGTQRVWTAIASALAAFSGLVALGYHTPVFGWVCRALPLVFGFPHPANYLIGVFWALAILAGVGVAGITTNPPSRGAVAASAWPVVAAAAVVVAHPDISSFEWQNQVANASSYVIVAAVLLLTVAGLPRRLRGNVLWAAVLAEILVSPVYRALHLPSGESPHSVDHTKWTLSRNPITQLQPMLRKIAEQDSVRFVGTRALLDNQAWVVNGRALLGMSAKPIFPSFERACSAFVLNLPYEQWLLKLPRFVSNMNVGYVIADREPAYEFLRPPEDLRQHFEDFNSAIEKLPVVERGERFDIRALPTPLPYVYTQDRISAATHDEQFTRVMDGDLREGAYVSPEIAADHPTIVTDAPLPPDVSALAHFEKLQKTNAVLSVDRSNPNRKAIHVKVGHAALLVIAETWHPGWRGRVDGHEVPVWQVNYLQQGIWLEPGTHRVELYFRPTDLVYGAAASAASLLGIALVAIGGERRRRVGAGV